jgi:hypothetical protein
VTSRQEAKIARQWLADSLQDAPDFAGAGLRQLNDGEFVVCVNFFSEPVVAVPDWFQGVRVTTRVVGHAKA